MKNIFWVSGVCMAAIMLATCGGGGGSSSTPITSTPPPPAANNAPTLAAANADQSARVGAAFTYDATGSGAAFTDADGDTLSYSVTYSPAAQGLTDNNGVISGSPSAAGTVTVTITADDGNGGQVSDTFDIVISPAASTSGKPNIIFVISDDQGKDASAEYSLSTDRPTTPHLTTLANNGVIFENLWVSPTCSPTRAGLITGKHSVKTTVYRPGDALPPTETIVQKFLKNDPATSEYASAMIGKWHLGGGRSGPNDFGLDHFAGITTGGVSDYFNWDLNINGATSTNTNYVTSELTDQAIEWTSNQTTPWFLWLSYNAPHSPFHLPPSHLHSRSLSGTQADITANPRPYYLASIEALDTEFGRLWNSLSAQEQTDTIVIYIGDNGTPNNIIDRSIAQRGNKGSLFEGGVNTPMFVSGAGVTRKGEREEALINHTDFFSTIAEITGASLGSYQDGQSFKDLLSDENAGTRAHSLSETNTGWAVRGPRYKLIEAANGGQDLFDLQSDPAEQTDLLDGSSNTSAILSELETAANNIRSTVNISGVKFSNTSPVCSDYAGQYRANATDVARDIDFEASLEITSTGSQCTFTSNSIPNHNFNDGAGAFPNDVGPVTESFSMPVTRAAAPNTTALSLRVDNAILLNGVKVDVLAAACFGVGNERVGCNDINQPWRFDPMHGPNGFNVDANNAHAQPDGAYHYHGPAPIFNGDAQTVSGVIGFAADGFPIYGPYFNDNGTIRTASSSYRLKSGARPSAAGDPGGTYDGMFRDDYEFVSGLGDLDSCNGMTRNGQYGYYVTGAYPYIIGCFTGTPDPSFNK